MPISMQAKHKASADLRCRHVSKAAGQSKAAHWPRKTALEAVPVKARVFGAR